MNIYSDAVFITCLLLVVWFKTDAFVEYVKLFKLSRRFSVDDFEEKYSSDFELTYHDYLRKYKNSFLIRLVTCPICLTVWLLIPTFFVKYSLGEYSLNVLTSLFIYYLFSKLMR
jgi:hypothetical protein